jgi:hypothetical protein
MTLVAKLRRRPARCLSASGVRGARLHKCRNFHLTPAAIAADFVGYLPSSAGGPVTCGVGVQT